MNKRPMRFLLAVLIAIGGICAGQEKQPPKPPFTITISMSQTQIGSGSAAPLKLSLINTSDRDLRFGVGIIHGPVFKNEKGREIDIQVRDSDGKAVAETEYGKTIHGRSVLPPPVTVAVSVYSGAIYMVLAPGRTLKEESDLNKEFDLSKPGTYTVQVLRKDLNTGVTFMSNALTFTIVK